MNKEIMQMPVRCNGQVYTVIYKYPKKPTYGTVCGARWRFHR